MFKSFLTLIAVFTVGFSFSQSGDTLVRESSLVDYDAFKELVNEVEVHRAERLISLEEMHSMSSEENTIILDTRSKAMYDAKHVKGAIHLCFSDFTQTTLATLIPDTKTRIIIYCNNNFANDQIYFQTKSANPKRFNLNLQKAAVKSSKNKDEPTPNKPLGITMALNIPTYINLYGYGYENVYELKDLISVYDENIKFEGTAVFE